MHNGEASHDNVRSHHKNAIVMTPVLMISLWMHTLLLVEWPQPMARGYGALTTVARAHGTMNYAFTE